MANNAEFSTKKLNVLVYSGKGSTVESVRHVLYTLRRLLAAHYAVIPVTGDMIIKEPWIATCAMLVIPGGADLGYCKALNGEGNRRIMQFVRRGGAYLGLCAGGYYGSKKCEFEVGNKYLEVVGDRELAFYPGICRGLAFPGFVYHSEAGARAPELKVNKSALNVGTLPDLFHSYYNGGGVFVDAPSFADRGVEILASYTEELRVNPGEGAAAIVYCKVGDGGAILTGPHPEFVFAAKQPLDDWKLIKSRFAAVNLDKSAGGRDYPKLVDTLTADDKARTDFLKACLIKLGLEINQETTTVPSLSCLHLSSLDPAGITQLSSSLEEVIIKEDGKEFLKDENDTFLIERPQSFDMKNLEAALSDEVEESTKTDQKSDSEDRIIDYNSIIKRLILHGSLPNSKLTPYFNHQAFYANLETYRSQSKEELSDFGSQLLYGEVVTSTNTILEKNTQLLRRLPQGFTAAATVQVAGRGRGSNVWVSPSGALIFSTVIRHPAAKMEAAPVVFIQYLAALAVVRGIKTYDKGYENLPVKMKWPNDIYALDPSQPGKKYTKICGILVNSHYSASEYISVVGIGLNATNALPTTSLVAILSHFASSYSRKIAQSLTLEKLLARILTVFEELYRRFLRTGFDRTFEEMYYDDWLHMHQVVTLEEEGGARARIKGITRDYGLLIAEELGWEDRPTGRVWQLQSDSNSFDFFRGLVKRKV